MAPAAALVFAGKSVATAAISFLINKAFTYLNDYFKAEGMEDVNKRLLLALPKIQSVFDVVNPIHIREGSNALDAWLWKLRDAAEEAEDVIDELKYYEFKEKAEDAKVSDWGSSFSKMNRKVVKHIQYVTVLDKTVKCFTHHSTLKRLRKAVEGLDRAATGVVDFLMLADCLKGFASNSQQQEHLMNRECETSSMLTATEVFGRDKEKELIVGWLIKTTSDEEAEIVVSTNHISIISIVGHGGMGKTTLAQLICKDVRVLKRFKKVIWVCVSTSFDATTVTSKILESCTWVKPNVDTLEALQHLLREKLDEFERFLLILDDVWEDKKSDQWERIFAPLRSGKSGSKILLTTRMKSVAKMATNVMGGEGKCLTLYGLEERDNLRLFNQHFASLQEYSGLQSIGEEIAKKLGGCPLVTKVVSGHLLDNLTYQYWNRFFHERLEHFEESAEDIMKVIKLSYYHLPTELQICFRYCSIFPQDYRFKKEDLVKMWICSGLISQAVGEAQRPEEIAEEYLARLTRKSFFDCLGGDNEEYYVMHDLMHDMATVVSSGECARMTNDAGSTNVVPTVRHLSIAGIDSIPVEEIKKISHLKNLRTIIIENPRGDCKDIVVHTIEKIVESSKSLRLLIFRLWNTSEFLVKLSYLKHLRYIRLDRMSVEGIHGISKLYHLIVGDFMSFADLLSISGEKASKHFRHLGYLDRLQYINYGPLGFGNFPIGRLTSLQNLQGYYVGKNGCKISALGELRNLRELEVWNLENIESHEEVMDARLKEKQHLRRLSLHWSECNGVQSTTDDSILDLLEPHANLENLTISGYDGVRLPNWIMNLFVKNLVVLTLKGCINWDYIPSLGELLFLKHLDLVNLIRLKQIGIYQSFHGSSFGCSNLPLPSSLRTLKVNGCKELKELPLLPPSLVRLEINDVGLTKLPGRGEQYGDDMRALRVLEISNCIHLECASLLFEEMNELREFSIINCPRLTNSTNVGDKLLPLSLEKLHIRQCGDLEFPLLGSVQGLTNLSDLTMENLMVPTTLSSTEGLTNLVMLRLKNFLGLTSLPSAEVCKTLKSLKRLRITGCENLSSLGGLGFLPSLQSLSICGCSKLTEVASSLPLNASGSNEGEGDPAVPSSQEICQLSIDLPSLLLLEPLKSLCHTKELIIEDGSKMMSLPERWLQQNRTSLQSLIIREAKSLESLPASMQDLRSLKILYLWKASRLQSLPDLPSSQQVLVIVGCNSELEELSRKRGSSVWNKISHIRQVQLVVEQDTGGGGEGSVEVRG